MTSDIASLQNLGPRSAEMLATAGIHTREQLAALGPAAAYLAAKQADSGVSLNLLWAIAAGMENSHWTDLSQQRKAELRTQVEALENG